MKKAVIAGGVLALGAAWTGAAWYSGKMAEAFLRESLEQDNAQAKALGESTGFSIVTELISLERGVFSLKTRFRLQISILGEETREIEFVEQADHGPFPFRRLAAGDFRPAMAAGRYELQDTPKVAAWFAATRGVTPLKGTFRVSYEKKREATYEFAPMTFVKDGATMAFSGMTAYGSLEHDTKASEFSGQFDSLTLDQASKTNGLTGMALQGAAFTLRSKPGKNNILLSDQKLAFKKLAMTYAAQPPISVQETSVALNLIETDSGLDLKTTLDLGMINAWKQDVAAARLAMDLKNLDADALSAFGFINLLVYVRAWQGGGVGGLPVFSSNDLAELAISFDQLLMGSAHVSLTPLQLRSAAGVSNVNLDMELLKQEAAAPGSAGLARLRKLHAQFELSQAGTLELLVFWARFLGLPPDQTRELVRPKVEAVVALGAAMGVLKIENDTIRSSVSVTGEQVDVNGIKMPLNQFLQWIGAGAANGKN